jgi:hypothetical protein
MNFEMGGHMKLPEYSEENIEIPLTMPALFTSTIIHYITQQ